jgi:LysR family transcriptional regulator for bpeEF and oprC
MDRLEALKIFCSVVESGGFSKAADRLGISTSSVTNQIVALEQHFNIKLLNRTTRSMSMTDEGRQCYEQALHLLSEMSDLERDLMHSTKTPSGMLRVEMPSVICRLYVAPAMPRFIETYPNVSIKMTVNDRMIDMVEEGVDVMIRIGHLQSSNLIAKTLCKTRYMCCASPEFIKKNGTPSSPENLNDFPCLSFLNLKSRQVRPWQFDKENEKYLFLPQAKLGMDHVESSIEAAKAGCGIVQHMSISLLPSIRAGHLVPILEDWSPAGPDVSILFQQKQHRPAKINAFVGFAEGLFKSEK